MSPSVAGPIPGVNITTPKVNEPATGTKFAVDKQPITLAVENASTNGVRPLSYVFEVATDAQFTTIVFTKADVAPGSGKTSLQLPTLNAEKTYFWRALAKDGANTGTYTPTGSFSIFTPVVINAPTLVAPVPGDTVTTLTPTLVVANAVRSGPVGAVYYQISIGETEATFVDGWFIPENGATQTSFQIPAGYMTAGKRYVWRVRAYDGVTVGPWSAVGTFLAPAAVVVPGPIGGGGGGGAAGATDFAALGNVTIVGGSPDVRGFAITSQITSLQFSPGNIHLTHTKLNQWPSIDIGGALQEMTLWVFFKIGGQWYATGGERWRPGQTDKTLSAPSAIGPGWFYNSQWAPMTNYVPAPGELVGFMVVAGSTRADTRASVPERSSILMIPFPADGVTASFP